MVVLPLLPDEMAGVLEETRYRVLAPLLLVGILNENFVVPPLVNLYHVLVLKLDVLTVTPDVL